MSRAKLPAGTDDHGEYDAGRIAYLEVMWGEGYLSPGGDAAVADIVSGLDLRHRRVLDIGCGTGGADLALVRNHDAGHVVGIDVEAGVLEHAHRRIAPTSLASLIEFRQVHPGPLPLPDASFDVVFSKDSMIHIPDKPALYAEVFRVLRPGGVFAASDWLRGEGEPGDAMRDWLANVGLSFSLATPGQTRAALLAVGFVDVELASRNEWSRRETAADIERMRGRGHDALVAAVGAVEAEQRIARNVLRLAALEEGDLDPTHVRAWRPAAR